MKKGQTNNPNGRPKGSPNRKTQELMDIAERLECNPFEVLLLFAKGDFESLGYEKITYRTFGETTNTELTISPELRQKAAKDACEYLFPKRKSVEVTTDLSKKSDEDLLSEAQEILVELSELSRS